MNTFANISRDELAWRTIDVGFADSAEPFLHRKTLHWLDGEQLRPRIANRRFAEAEISELVVPPVRVAQPSSPDGDLRYHLVCLLEGHGHYRCEAGEFTQTRGDTVLINSAEACEVTSPVSTHILRWSLPRDALAPMLPHGEVTTTRIPGSQGMNRVLNRHALELARAAGEIPIEAQRGLLLHLCGLIGLTLGPGADRRVGKARNYRMQMRQRILAYVESHSHDPGLTARRAAEELGISTRRLHAFLEESSLSFSDLVARRRVQKSLGLLERQEPDAVPITEIAYLSGFEDLSTYYRRFRRYMHMTPGEWRSRFR
jgi:AraC-like DNA-binding protein